MTFSLEVNQSPRGADPCPFAQELPAGIENLNPLVGSVRHIDFARRIKGHIMDQVKLAIAFTLAAPMGDVVSLFLNLITRELT